MAQANLTKTSDIIAAREIDFVSRFSNNWQDLVPPHAGGWIEICMSFRAW